MKTINFRGAIYIVLDHIAEDMGAVDFDDLDEDTHEVWENTRVNALAIAKHLDDNPEELNYDIEEVTEDND